LPVGFAHEPDENGRRLIWLAPHVVNRLRALRGPGESYSDVILRLAEAFFGPARKAIVERADAMRMVPPVQRASRRWTTAVRGVPL
jgi:hypothetical protein